MNHVGHRFACGFHEPLLVVADLICTLDFLLSSAYAP